jgi:hypothetical protein
MVGMGLGIPQGGSGISAGSGGGALALDFTASRYALSSGYRGDIGAISGWAYTRTGAATALDLAGVVVPFAANSPRVTSRGILIESAGTNLVPRSQEFDNASWTKGGASISANATTAPDGTTTADLLTENTSTGDHRAFQSVTVPNATACCFSVYLKPNGRSLVQLTFAGVGDVVFNISTGAVSTTLNGSGEMTAAANGWYRCVLKFTTATTSYNAQVRLVSTGTTSSYTGDGASGVYVWGAQVEATAAPTSYVPTAAASATRSIDAATVTVPAGVSAYTATYGGGTTATGAVTPGASFDLVTGRPWIGNYLERLVMR